MTWIHYADEDGDALIARDETSDPFACVWVRAGLATPADADLIAAAPDLLAALESMVRIAKQTNTVSVPRYVRTVTVTFDPSTLVEACAAIKKARGEK